MARGACRDEVNALAPGLYAHIPFCSAICHYCNFNRGLFDESLKVRFVAALLEEIRSLTPHLFPLTPSPSPLPPDTLYFGGGTPSLLTPSEIRSIIDESRRSLGLVDEAEITLEANPETVDAALLEGVLDAGVNRLSVGVQSFHDDELERLGRLHSAERARRAVDLARAVGFDNISIDLMMWLPGQDVPQWLTSVEEAIRVAPDHLSLYILEVYAHLPLRQEIDRHGWKQAPEDGAAEMYEMGMAILDGAGYQQYEISNVCRPGRRSRHNLKYWMDGEWWGIGPGAHSTWRGGRWRNVSSIDEYLQRIAARAPVTLDHRQLSPEEQLGDALFMGLRLSEGIDLEVLSTRYGIDVWERFGGRLGPYCEAGILIREGDRLRLTRQGMLLANEVMAVFV